MFYSHYRIGRWIAFVGILLTASVQGQKILVLENRNTLKNFKYMEGNRISLSLLTQRAYITDEISDMTDSSLILMKYGEVGFPAIRSVIRENWFVTILSGFSLLAGTLYFGIDSFNRLINEEWPMIDEKTLAISTGVVGFGFVLLPFRNRKIPVGEKWQLRVIDPGAL